MRNRLLAVLGAAIMVVGAFVGLMQLEEHHQYRGYVGISAAALGLVITLVFMDTSQMFPMPSMRRPRSPEYWNIPDGELREYERLNAGAPMLTQPEERRT